ncbi:MAG: methylenetetrahydrofolate reductase C-terminal domain-containing protein [Anaerolineae bacterium]
MIITEQKPFEEILAMLAGHDRVFLIGCSVCATTWGTGGEKEVREMAARLEEAGKVCVGWLIPEGPTCEAYNTRAELQRCKAEVSTADALLVLACGAGVQAVGSFRGKPNYPALNSLFVGQFRRPTLADERCRLCGECILAETGGLCPVALCPKELMNGPCGGYEASHCEVDRTRPCAWVAIYQRMKKLDQMEKFKAIRPPKDWSKRRRPGVANKSPEVAS